MATESQLKKKIQSELTKAHPNMRLVGELTEQILDQQDDAVRFSIDAQHINRLGLELVGKQDTALSELIKNAYDADATTVDIAFSDHDQSGGTLRISDNGSGMSADTIRQTWMRISTSEKEDHPVSERYGRRRAGKKGIGRFAVQRLGKSLVLETTVAGDKRGLRVTFNWDDQFVAGKSLSNIWNEIEYFDKPAELSGTTLQIMGLRDKWSEATLKRVWTSVLSLQPPFPIARASRAKRDQQLKYEIDPGFQVEINVGSENEVKQQFSVQKSFLDQAVATISGRIDEKGKATFEFSSKSLDTKEKTNSDTAYLLTGPVRLKVYYFIYATDLLTGITQRAAGNMGREFGGVRIYRDGFHVLPYGQADDDWLELARDTARRNILVPLNNSNLFGYVEINRTDNVLLEQTSSREGLIENEAYLELCDFSRKCLEWAALRIAALRKRKQRASQPDFVSVARKPTEILDEAIEEIASSKGGEAAAGDASGLAVSSNALEVLTEARGAAEEYETEQEARRKEMLVYEGMLRILASLGLSISVFGHEIKGTGDSVQKALRLFDKTLGDANLGNATNDVNDRAESIREAIDRVFRLGDYISTLMTHTESRELASVSVRGVVSEFVDQFSDYMKKQAVDFSVDIVPPELRTCPIHRSEMDSVLFNFLTNSIKSLRRAKTKDRRINISATEEGNFVVLRFEDNGAGIPKDDVGRVFDAFFTTTEQDPDEIAGPGTGLGLKIVSDIAHSYGGSVSLTKPSADFATCFEFSILKYGIDSE